MQVSLMLIMDVKNRIRMGACVFEIVRPSNSVIIRDYFLFCSSNRSRTTEPNATHMDWVGLGRGVRVNEIRLNFTPCSLPRI